MIAGLYIGFSVGLVVGVVLSGLFALLLWRRLRDKKNDKQMEQQLTQPECRHHQYNACKQCPDVLIMLRYDLSTLIGFAIPIKDGGDSYISIYYCPFCGTNLRELLP